MEQAEIEVIIDKDNLRCKKCSLFPDITIYNYKNRVNVYLECENKHINTPLLDEYIKDNHSYNNNANKCEKCENKKGIKECQFCKKYLCEECNKKHLTIEHIVNNQIVKEIEENKYINNIDGKHKDIKKKMKNSLDYLKEIIRYYKELEDKFKKFLIDNINEIILIKLLINNYIENKNEEKLINNIDYILKFNKLEFKTNNLNEYLLNNKNYILYGDRYKGEIKNEEYEGKGKMEYYNGIYEGEWKNGKREGFGIYKYNNNEKYMGIWKNNLEDGEGRYIYNNGDIYDGKYKEGKKEGKGLYIYNNNNEIIKYYGEWKNDKKNGEGIIYYKNGDEIEGIWEDNIMNNKLIKYRYINGDIYIGEYDNNKRNGKGIMKYNNKEIYNGE